ncbi:MaoC family dehydratase N-terminal domain-containing protein [Actinocorallia sp. B10E7]|uniref:FAS1-like dehydratase domain-containing protein n=1 Tax=Actinocorallia sp. B10E7 TaxID=3153558 RepID=UPI00325F0614
MTTGKITDEGVARLRSRIGVPQLYPAPPHYRRPGEDAFRHIAWAYGDDNPLWSDPAYAAGTRWKGSIAPPALVGGDSLIGEDTLTEEELARQPELKGDPLRGVHAFYAASEREWWAPLTPGHRVFRRTALVGVVDKPSEFGGRGVQEWTAQAFQADDGTLLGAQYRMMYRTEREKARARKKYDDVAIEPWTEERIAELDAQYEAEKPRGAEPRWWEDVEEGQKISPLVKGPLTVTDMVCWHVGMGMGMYNVAPLRLAHHNRKRVPRFYHRDELGVPDAMQRVHWDPAFARKSGNPTTFDYGRMRETWLIHACTDWMGDDAWLWRLRVEFRKFNYVGDVQWVEGEVVRKYLAEGDRPAVDLELRTRNQRGEVTSPASATVLLPSREHGPVHLPDPPGSATTLEAAFDATIDRFARER